MTIQNTTFGLSPAFVLAGWGERFTPADYIKAAETAAALGFAGLQLEVFFPEQLGEWLDGGAAAVAARCRSLGLRPAQFVAHFLMPATGEDVESRSGPEEMRRVLGILEHFPACRVVTLPIGGMAADRGRTLAPAVLARLRGRLADKIAAMLAVVEGAGLRLALEVPPGTLLAGSGGFLALARAIGSDGLGFNLDTGHAWACGERVEELPSRLAGRLLGTHLCDNFGVENAKMRPGAGSIPWEPLLRSLLASGYMGSLDLEIRCPRHALAEEYGAGVRFLSEVLERL